MRKRKSFKRGYKSFKRGLKSRKNYRSKRRINSYRPTRGGIRL